MKTLVEKYKKEVMKDMKEKFGYENQFAIPKIEKIIINSGVGRLSQQPSFEDKILPELIKEIAAITGQRPIATKAKKSIAGFKTRIGQIIGMKVTLRKEKMFYFLDKLINIILPRVRDFKGIDLKNIDKNGNLTIGLKEQTVFPEISPENSKVNFGLQISIVSNAKNKEEAIELYKLMGIPFKKN
mgnify:FL=1